jgi:subtilisin family serine protease
MSEADFKNQLGSMSDVIDTRGFSDIEKMQILKINSTGTAEESGSMLNTLRANPVFEHISPVFNVPEELGNPKVEMGFLNDIIVQFKSDLPKEEINSMMEIHGLEVISKLDLPGGDSYHFKVINTENSMRAANEIFETGKVNYSEPNFFYTNLLLYTPNDQFFSSQWSIRNTGNNIPQGIAGTVDCDMDVDSAWDISLGSSAVIVSVVDTGIDTLHPDLSSRIVNGKGYNFYSNNSNSMDDNNHGTSCAGIIAAEGNNSIGVSGIAPNARIFGIKIFNSSGSTTTAAITNGLIYTVTSGCWISSNSWGGGTPISAAENAITNGVTNGRGGKGVVYCFATGNSNASSISWPSNRPEVIAVGGISPCNQRKSTSSCDNETWWGSQYGTGLTIVAPCVKIYTTDRRGAAGYSSTDYVQNFNGTSSATPNTSGVCALVLGLDSTLRWDSVRVRLARYADKVGAYTYNNAGSLGIGGWNDQMGYGRVNAFRVMQYTVAQMTPVAATIKLTPQGFYNSITKTLNTRDTVTLYLRSSSAPFSKIDSAKGVLDSVSLTMSAIFPNAPSGTYYISVKHRNSIDTWSKAGGESYTKGSPFLYDFTTTASKAYGSNGIQVDTSPVVFACYNGDSNRDNVVDLSDITDIFNKLNVFATGYLSEDATGDLYVDLDDLTIAYNNLSLIHI